MPQRLSWTAEVPEKTRLCFQLRWAETEDGLEAAPWCGPEGEGTYYEQSGAQIRDVPGSARYLQYRAGLMSLNGCRSPKLEEVRVDFGG